MRSFWSDPFLWIHLAGFAALPLWLELCWLGLAAGNPVLPFWLELLLIAAIGIAPIFWMQWQRPFYIFSLIAVVLRPAQLTEDQRRLLTLFKSQRNRYLAIVSAVIAFLALRQLYYLAPIAASVTPFTAESRWLGLLVAAIAFLGVNLFLQVPVSVLSVMLTGESTFATTAPYPLEQMRSDFTLLGIPVNQILPPVTAEPEPVAADTTLGMTAPLEAARPAPEPSVEPAFDAAAEAESAETESAEEWLADSATAATIPDGELERVTDATPAEPIRTEAGLETDVWDEEATIAPEVNLESAAVGEPEEAVSSAAGITAEEITAVEDMANEPLTQPEAVVAPEAVSSSEGLTALAEVDNSAAIVDSEELTDPEPGIGAAIVDSEASTPDSDSLPSTHQDPEPLKE